MPGLTLNTSSHPTYGSKQPLSSPSNSPVQIRTRTSSRSRSSTPPHPPYSPITPTLSHAHPTTHLPESAQATQITPRSHFYTHSQAPQTSIPAPPPIPLVFDDNPDTLALKSAISILQLQKRRAESDIKALAAIKEKAMVDPTGFVEKLAGGEIKTLPDQLFSRATAASDDEEGEGDEEEQGEHGATSRAENPSDTEMNLDTPPNLSTSTSQAAWPQLPAPQNIVRCPPINWAQYAIVGAPLDKLHQDQVAHPVEGTPVRMGPNGRLAGGGGGGGEVGGESLKRVETSIAGAYVLGKEKVIKTGGKKGRK